MYASFGQNLYTVPKSMYNAGMFIPMRGKRGRRRITPETESAIIEAYIAGTLRVCEIAETFGISKQTIYDVIKRNQKPPTPQGQAAAESEDTDHRAKDTPKAVGDGN